jgi:hypothetical protein
MMTAGRKCGEEEDIYVQSGNENRTNVLPYFLKVALVLLKPRTPKAD